MVDAEIENWNHATVEYRNALEALNQRRDREATRPIFGTPPTFGVVMALVAMGNYSAPQEVIWSVQAQTSLQFRDPKTEQDIGISKVPPQVETCDFVAKVQACLAQAREWPASMH